MADWNSGFIGRSLLFAPLLPLAHYVQSQAHWPQCQNLNDWLTRQEKKILTHSGKTIRFVPQIIGKQPTAQKYETKIYQTGEVPTRTNNWHDFFNALVWQTFPRTKSILNQIHFHAQQLDASSLIHNRCELRDAATLFDESGVIVVSAQPSLSRLLVNFEWKSLFWQQRAAVLQSMRFFVFGHSLYEKALNPYTGMTGKGIVFDVDQAFFTCTLAEQLKILDTLMISFLSNTRLSKSHLTPVPILGYPGWIEENQCEAYYDNKQYFRDRRSVTSIA